MNSEKSVVYEGRNKYRNIIQDQEMVEVVLGMIDECLETEREEVDVLKLAYDVIDAQKYMIEAESKEEAEKGSVLSKLFLKYYKKKEEDRSK